MSDELKRLQLKRRAVQRQLQNFFMLVEDGETEVGVLRERYERIPEIWQQFESLGLDIECALHDAADQEAYKEHVKQADLFESRYYAIMADVRKKLKPDTLSESDIKTEPSSRNEQQSIKIKLPPLTIQPFSGKYDEWLAFKDAFKKAVHEQHLPDVQKFQILRGLLKDDALKVISAFEATENNYHEAWELLEGRYENKRLIINTHMKGLFELSVLNKSNHHCLRNLVDLVRTHTRSLKSLKQPVETWDTILIYLITSKLDSTSKEEWEKEIHSDMLEEEGGPSLDELLRFLEKRCNMLEMLDKGKPKAEVPQTTNTFNKRDKKITLATTANSTNSTFLPRCSFCNNQHKIYQCEKLLKLSSDDKNEQIRKLRLCLNCLRPGHQIKDCRSMGCKKCGRKHNTLLHRQDVSNPGDSSLGSGDISTNQVQQANQQEPVEKSPDQRQIIAHCVPKLDTQVLLSTVRVYVFDTNGLQHECRALIDPGSQINFMTDDLAMRLKVESYSINLPVSGVNKSEWKIKKATRISIKSSISSYSVEQECLIIPEITSNIPQMKLNTKQLYIPSGIKLADPNFWSPGRIDLLIGAGLFWKLLIPGENITNKGQPTLQNTQFGWIIGGEYTIQKNQPRQASCNLIASTLHKQIEKFWEIEEVHGKQKHNNGEYCEQHFQQTHTRDVNGRFIVELPQDISVPLGESFQGALNRLQTIERRFSKQPELKKGYVSFLKEYEQADHMTQLQEELPKDQDHYYIPHQPVIKTSSITTKLRVVFDASAKTSLGTSLNDRLLPGPNLQNDIVDILLRFRTHQYVMSSDIAQMFRQIRVSDKHKILQLILWRENSNDPINTFTLNTVTYGTASAPFLAMRCLRELAIKGKDVLPQAAAVLEHDFYMDDLLTGTSTLQGAIKLLEQIIKLSESGKFHLRKWRANDPRILQRLENAGKTEELLILSEEDSIKTLGLLWNSREDVLQYNVQLSQEEELTKRKLLSAIAQIYDPLGLIGPTVITAKLIMQELWKLELGWDERIPSVLEKSWQNYCASLKHLSSLEVQRNVNPRNQSGTLILHGFSDASEKAYGACVYVVSTDENYIAQSNLLCSKSKVAPLKGLTLPRLELSAALLLAKLIDLVRTVLTYHITEVHLWSDSTITLSWISRPPLKKTFEANRVAEIHRLTSNCQWHHVPTKENPADLVSRGLDTQKLIRLDLWWNGPPWLCTPEDWPPQIIRMMEGISETLTFTAIVKNDEIKLLRRFQSFIKLQRVIAYCYRYRTKHKGPLSVEELNIARTRILIWTQTEAFPEETSNLQAGKTLATNSFLLRLNPFVDQEGLIRVGGRLRNATIPEEQKHQIILPAKHHITHIIMREEHEKLMHCGPQQLLFHIRQKYWPISGGREARRVTTRCVACYRYKPKVPEIRMGDLPKPRVTVSAQPFETTGVDYAGPLQVRESKRRGRIHISKSYIAIFTCFATKAVHLELVTDLSTEAFLAALRRFVNRRGVCNTICSDNATNFVGASRELKQMYEFLGSHEDEIKTGLSLKGISWKFIPPRSPHFGGLWESAVKSVKRHLYTVTKGLIYTYEEYYTFLTEIEAILNSRPLMPISSDPNDLTVLTPAHFLIAKPSMLEPDSGCFTGVADTKLTRWQQIQKLKQHFWKRWETEYLHHLQTRTKWKSGEGGVEPGTMVLLIDDTRPPLRWDMGRVIRVIPGTDGIVRVADVRTAAGIFRRAVKKLCVLPFAQ